MSKSISLIIRKSPFDMASAKEALDVALLFGSFEQDISVFFLEDGVFQLNKNIKPELIGSKDYTAVINALPIYDVEKVFCCQDSLEKRSMTEDSIKSVANVISPRDLQAMINQSEVVLNF